MPAHTPPQSAEAQPVLSRIAFVDTSIHDYRSIVDSIDAGIEIVLIDGQADGVAQIAAALSGRSGIEAVHIFSHGSEGRVNLGTAHLSIDSIGAHASALSTIGAALATNADILLYGCDVGAGTRGIELLDALALATGADIAASGDLTGNAALGGNWMLERSSGVIEAGTPFADGAPAFGGALASVYFDGNEPGYYAQQSISTQVDNVAFTFGVRDPNGQIGYNAEGLYAYADANGEDDVELLITVADGYSFDLGSLQVSADAPDMVGENRDITFTFTRANGSTGSVSYTLSADNTLLPLGGLSSAMNDVTSVAVSANRYAVFNNFEITDVKPIGPADTTAPVITGVSIPNQPMKIGSVVTATITVAADSDSYTLGAGSTVGGYTLGNLQKVNDTTWTATFTVTAGSPDVAAGANIAVNLVLRDSANNASTAYTAPIVQAGDPIDPNPPAPPTVQLEAGQDTGWSSTDGVTRIAQPTLSGTAEANGTVTVNIDGADVASGIAVDASGKWSYTPAMALVNGPHTIKALATDAAGNSGAYGADVSVRIDTVAPTAAAAIVVFSNDTGTSASDLVTNQASQTVAGTLSASLLADERVMVSIDNGLIWQLAPSSGNAWSLPGQTLVSSNTLQVKVVDQAGNDGPVAAFAYVLDTVAPTISVGGIALSADTGTSNTDFVTRGGAQTVSATLSAPLAAGDTLYGSTNGGAVWTNISASISGTALNWSTTLRDGSNALAFRVMDQAGNLGAVTVQTYTLDTIAPTASVAGVAFSADNGVSSTDLITNVAAQTISGTLSADLANGERVMVSLDNGSSWTFAANDGARAWSLAGQTLAGSGAIRVQVTDAAGNTGPAVSRAYVLDTTAPTTVVGSIGIAADSGSSSSDFITNVAAQTVSATLSAALAAGDSLLASADGGAHWTDISAMVDGTSVTWTGVTLTPGAGTLQFRVSDLAGNAGPVSTRAYTLDTAAPGAQATSLAFSADSGESATDLVTNTAAQTLGGTLDRTTDTGDAVRVSLDNGAHWSWAEHVAGSSAWSLGGQVLSHSDTVLVQVVDAAGNAGPTLSRAYVLDTTAPSASVTSAVIGVGAAVTTARSNETGAVYLVEASLVIAGQADLDAALLAGTATRADVALAATDTIIGTTGLAAGSYRVVAVDKAGNVGAASSGAVTLLAAPNAHVASVAFSNDSGASSSDFVTRIAAQDISGTLSAPTVAGERVEVSFDGLVWQTAVHVVGSTGWTLAGQVLSGSGTLQVRVSNELVSSQVLTQAYVLDTAAPAAPGAPVLAAASDSGVAGDGITNVDRPVLSGTAEALAQITVYDNNGSTVIGTTRADADGAWQITTSQLARGAHTITVRQTDVAGNMSDAGAALALTIEGTVTPTPPTSPTTPPLVDGVPVQVAQVTLPGGVMGTAISVPIVTAGRTETSGQSGVADIPLASAGGATLLLAQLATGYGLSASGASVGMTNGLEFLIASIKAATPNHAPQDQGHLTGNGEDFLGGLAATGSLLVQTVTPLSTGTASGTLTLSGPGGSGNGAPSVALVIDAGGIGAGSTIALKQVDFAAVIGSANVVASGSKVVLSGDAAGQQFTVGTGDASEVFAGGGGDTLRFGASSAPATATGSAQAQAHAMNVPSATTTLLHGGQDSDVAVFAGARADYHVEQHNGYLMVASVAAPDAKAMVVNVEKLQFSDGSVEVHNIAEMDILAGMYQTVLGRQADVGGIAFWADGLQAGTSWGQTVLDFIESAESEASHGAFNGDADHDLAILYAALFDRAPDAQGMAFWKAALDSGVSLERIAGEFVQSAELVGHQRAALAWDFIV